MTPELMERAETVLNTFATIERKALALADKLVVEADLSTQTKLFLSDEYTPLESLTSTRLQDTQAYIARLRSIASEAMAGRVRTLRELGEQRALNDIKGFAFMLKMIEWSADSLARSLKKCRKEVKRSGVRLNK